MGAFGIATGLAGSIGASIAAKESAKEIQKKLDLINKQELEEKSWFDKQYYTDITKRTDVQNMLRLLDEQQRKQSSINEAKSAVAGATPEERLAAQDSINKATADATANIASESSALKDKYLEQWRNRQNEYYKQRLGLQDEFAAILQNESNQWHNLANNAFGTGASMLGNFDWSSTGSRIGGYKRGATRTNRTYQQDVKNGTYSDLPQFSF